LYFSCKTLWELLFISGLGYDETLVRNVLRNAIERGGAASQSAVELLEAVKQEER